MEQRPIILLAKIIKNWQILLIENSNQIRIFHKCFSQQYKIETDLLVLTTKISHKVRLNENSCAQKIIQKNVNLIHYLCKKNGIMVALLYKIKSHSVPSRLVSKKDFT